MYAVPSIKFEWFFDRPKVEAAMNKKTRTVLNRTGAFGMRYIRYSMKPGGKKRVNSDPGQPPRTHTKDLKHGILYQYEPERQTVIVGARYFNASLKALARGSKPVPQLLEEGGKSVATYDKTFLVRATGKARRNKKTGRFIKNGRVRVAVKAGQLMHYRPRPFIAPATPPAQKKMRELMASVELK